MPLHPWRLRCSLDSSNPRNGVVPTHVLFQLQHSIFHFQRKESGKDWDRSYIILGLLLKHNSGVLLFKHPLPQMLHWLRWLGKELRWLNGKLAYISKEDTLKLFGLFNHLKKADGVNIRKLCSVPTEEQGSLRQDVRKPKLMEITRTIITHCQGRLRDLSSSATIFRDRKVEKGPQEPWMAL